MQTRSRFSGGDRKDSFWRHSVNGSTDTHRDHKKDPITVRRQLKSQGQAYQKKEISARLKTENVSKSEYKITKLGSPDTDALSAHPFSFFYLYACEFGLAHLQTVCLKFLKFAFIYYEAEKHR